MSELSSKEVAALKSQAQSLSAALTVGKSGVTDAFVEEVRGALKREPLVKIKLLPSAREDADRHEVARDLATRAGAILVEVRGNTLVLYRGKRA